MSAPSNSPTGPEVTCMSESFPCQIRTVIWQDCPNCYQQSRVTSPFLLEVTDTDRHRRAGRGSDTHSAENHKPSLDSSNWDTASKEPMALNETHHMADFKQHSKGGDARGLSLMKIWESFSIARTRRAYTAAVIEGTDTNDKQTAQVISQMPLSTFTLIYHDYYYSSCCLHILK